MPLVLNGRIAIVTGATGGIGPAIARRLAANGAQVALVHLAEPDAAQAVAGEITSAGGTALALAADLRHEADVRSLHDRVREHFGPTDILISNAGAYPRITLEELSPVRWQEMLDVNLTSHYLLTRALTNDMAAQGWGRIITIGSVLAVAGRHELAGYITAKSALEGFTRALARELGPQGVTANCVAPGSIQVPAEVQVVGDLQAMTVRQLARQCVKRRGTPEDIAAAVAFLASADAGFITGQTIRVDGGWILG